MDLVLAARAKPVTDGLGEPSHRRLWFFAAGLGLLLQVFGSSLHAAELLNRGVSASLFWRHEGHSATLLLDGRLLVGGAEVFDPSIGVSEAIAAPPLFLAGMSAGTLLPDGRVLFLARNEDAESLTLLYDAVSGLWEVLPPPPCTPTDGHTATLLRDGRVLVAGGHACESTASIFDAGTGTWSPTDENPAMLKDAAAVRLQDGRVVILGGFGPETMFDPTTGTWSDIQDAPLPLDSETHGICLPDGRILVVGGYDELSSNLGSQIFDPRSGSWQTTGPLASVSLAFGLTLLPSGEVLLVGSDAQFAPAELAFFDPAGNTWMPGPPVGLGQDASATLSLLADGRVLQAGGGTGDALGRGVEVLSPRATDFVAGLPLPTTRAYGEDLVLRDGRLLLLGGFDEFGVSMNSVWAFDPWSMEWEIRTPAPGPWRVFGAVELLDGRVLVLRFVGPGLDDPALAQTYDPASDSWGTGLALPGLAFACATRLGTGEVLVVGGHDGALAAVLSADASSLRWVPGPWEGGPRYGCSALVTLQDGTVMHVPQGSFDAYRFDSWQGSWSSLAPARDLLGSSQQLPGGELLFASEDSIQIYDPLADSWFLGSPYDGCCDAEVLPLDDSDLVIPTATYGVGPEPSNLFDARTRSWSYDLDHTRLANGFGSAVFPSGELFLFGGDDSLGTTESLPPYPVDESRRPFFSESASFEVGWGAPRCGGSTQGCDTATSLVGRGGMAGGTEPNAPNTLDGCLDGDLGSFHLDESIDRILVSSGARPIVAGGEVTLEVELWAYSTDDQLDVYLAPDAAVPVWGLVETRALLAGSNRVRVTVPLGSGTEQALRAQLRYFGSAANPCEPGAYNDRDDLVLDVATVADPWRRPMTYGVPFTAQVSHLATDSEASGGRMRSSAFNHPIFFLRPTDGGFPFRLPIDPRANFSDDPMTVTISRLPPGIHPGPYFLTAVRAGVPSHPIPIDFTCNVTIDEPPADVTLAGGESATFTVSARGAFRYQWQKCSSGTCTDEEWGDIPGATGPSYTTPPVSPLDAGTLYRVRAISGCTIAFSPAASLRINDLTAPFTDVTSPDGGEFWLLSDPGPDGIPGSGDDPPAIVETVAWEMTDPESPICRVEISLWYSDDSGGTWSEAPPGGGLPQVFDQGEACSYPGITLSNLQYTVPTEFPSGQAGSLYEVRVTATNHAGAVSSDASARPFFVVRANPDGIATLILADPGRMESLGLASPSEASALRVKLYELSGHPRVQGFVVDLGTNTDVSALLSAWDVDPGDPDLANLVLTGCHEDGLGQLPPGCTQERDGIHDVVRELVTGAYTGVEHLVIVGDDRIVPFARMVDRAVALPESNYLLGGDLTDQSTVGAALAAGRYLSDDPLATLDPISLSDFSTDLFLPDLSVGRLVETPAEIIGTIAGFISADGVLDLPAKQPGVLPDPPDGDHRVQITGYDFLIDSGNRIRQQWRGALNDTNPQSTSVSPVDGVLIGASWGEATVEDRADLLRDHLAGAVDGELEPYGVLSLNGHANHHGEGVPGETPSQIEGLSARELFGPDACLSPGTAEGVDFEGAVVYSVGCHGGLPVPGRCATDADRSLDLPQTLLARGAQAYLANTGYGWGLTQGIGYSERLAEVLTEELTAGGTQGIGSAVVRAKRRYYLESPRFDGYDEKSTMEWTLYGLPMYAVRTGIAAGGSAPALSSLDEGRNQQLGAVQVERRAPRAMSAPPPANLLRLELHFDLTGPGVYRKYDSSGLELIGVSGCPDPEGCYYTLNGLVERASGASDLPLQPYLIYDSRLAGTSQHGVLWRGGGYDEEPGWVPVVAELASNGGDTSGHGSTPRTRMIRNIGTRWLAGEDPPECRSSDLESNSTVVVAGESLKSDALLAQDDTERRYRNVDLEVFYFNDPTTPGANCDREGPAFGTGPHAGSYHQAQGPEVSWSVPVSDAAGVWRVLVVYTDNGVDGNGRGAWTPLELEGPGQDGSWAGSVTLPAAAQVTYVVQAVDNRGNVSWLEWQTAAARTPSVPSECVGSESPSSGVELGIACPVDVEIVLGTADLAVSVLDSPDPVAVGGSLTYTIPVTNLGPSVGHATEVAIELPAGYGYLGTLGSGWGCTEAAGTVTCARPEAALGSAPALTVVGTAPGTAGTIAVTASVSGLEPDGVPGNDSETETTLVLVPLTAELSVIKSVDLTEAISGQVVTYTIVVANAGPDGVTGISITDAAPAGLSHVAWTCVASPGSSCTASGTGSLGDVVTLAAGGTVTYTAQGIVEQTAPGTLVNTASAQAPVGVTDAAGNNSDDATTAILLEALFGDGYESGYVDRWGTGEPCSHSVCEEGDALAPVCSACTAEVCSTDPACCLSSWDASCVATVGSACVVPCP